MNRQAFIIAALMLSGCKPIQVETNNRVAVDGPVETHVITELQAVPDHGPVKPVAVPSGDGGSSNRIAIIDIDGLLVNSPYVGLLSLGENPVALFREKLDAIAQDHCVRAVVLRINSPGGGVAATELMRRDLLRFRERKRIPVVACLMDVATGGAYYLASASDKIVALPSGVTGGVGVILNLYNLRDLMGQFNIVPQEIKAGQYTDLGSPARALTPEAKKLLQDMADEFHARLMKDIRAARPGLNADPSTLDGRIFTATQAGQRGLIDAVGDLDNAIDVARQLAQAPGASATLLRRKNDPARSIYAVTPNTPLQAALLPSIPGLDRSRLPTFLSVWQAEMTLEKLGGK